MRIHNGPRLTLTVIPMLLTAEVNAPTKVGQPLRAIPELIATRYCYGDAEAYSVWLKLRVKYVNRTDKTLILDKEIGKAWYGEMVARNLEELAAVKYEYNPNIDWIYSGKDKLPDKPSPDSPGSDFALLAPGDTFESEIEATVIAEYENSKRIVGLVGPGVHVFQMEVSAWNHPGKAPLFAESWRKFGELVI